MGTGYTRNDVSNNIADGNIINAADLDGEFDAVESAFNSSTGHTHDGTAAEGAPITVLGPVQDFIASATEIKPKTTNTLDIGTNSLQFKDMYLDGTAYIDGLGEDILVATDKKVQFRDTALFINSSADGQLDIDADVEVEITAPIVDINASTSVNISNDLKLDSDSAILSFGADSEITVTHEHDTGLKAKAASGFELNLQTSHDSIEATDVIGKITFNAPDEASGTDAILDGATIEAIAEDTFDASTNTTALVFKTNTSGAATERMRIKGDGTIVMDTQVDIDNITIDGNTISSTDTNGNIALTPNGTGEVDISKVDIDSGTIDGVTIGTNSVVTDLRVDNLKLDGNDISSTNTDGDVTITPNGTGSVDISKLKVASGAVAITSILDEDDLTSNSDTALATQQSVKAYVDSQIAGGSFSGGITAGASTFSGDITFEDDGNSSPNGYGIVFKEASATYTTTFNKVTPTADRTISLPDETGTVSTQAFANGAAVALAIALG